MNYQLVYDRENGAGVRVDNGKGVRFLINLSNVTDSLAPLKEYGAKEIREGQMSDNTKILLSAYFDSQQAFLLCLASHLAGCSGILNARGGLLKVQEGFDLAEEDRASIATALSAAYAEVRSAAQQLGLDNMPSLAVSTGGTPT